MVGGRGRVRGRVGDRGRVWVGVRVRVRVRIRFSRASPRAYPT